MSVERYSELMRQAIAEDSTRQQWEVQRWRAYFLEVITGTVPEYRITSADVLGILGPSRGAEVLASVEQKNRHVSILLEPAQGGIDLAHDDAPNFLGDLGLTPEEQRKVTESMTETQPRHVLEGLPDPRERLMKQALEAL